MCDVITIVFITEMISHRHRVNGTQKITHRHGFTPVLYRTGVVPASCKRDVRKQVSASLFQQKLRKSQPQFRDKVRKLRLRQKSVFIIKNNVYFYGTISKLSKVFPCGAISQKPSAFWRDKWIYTLFRLGFDPRNPAG